jgi:hypothetical protein
LIVYRELELCAFSDNPLIEILILPEKYKKWRIDHCMQKLLIRATRELAIELEEKLRYRYDVQLNILGEHAENINRYAIVCEIKAKVKRNWITICCFAPNENLKDILTMFQVNYELKARRT